LKFKKKTKMNNQKFYFTMWISAIYTLFSAIPKSYDLIFIYLLGYMISTSNQERMDKLHLNGCPLSDKVYSVALGPILWIIDP
jgi:hypothetical protein